MSFISRSFAVSTRAPAVPVVDRRRVMPRHQRVGVAVKREQYLHPVVPEWFRPKAGELRNLVARTAFEHGSSWVDVLGTYRGPAVIRARHAVWVAVAIARPRWSVSRIAKFFSRDHTTILNAFKRLGYVHGRQPQGRRCKVKLAEQATRRAEWRARVARGEASRNNQSKLTAEDVRTIRKRAALGETGYKMAAEYGICTQTVYDAINRKTWRNVQ